MPSIKQMARAVNIKDPKNVINWFPGHMYVGMQTMLGKLSTVDCIVEVHDARIPFTGRNLEFRKKLGAIKPHILVLNKRDLADLSRWDSIKSRLINEGDHNVILTDLTGSEFSATSKGYNKLLENVVKVINNSDRYNRQTTDHFKIMIAGIPNVGKSTLINRLRQFHLGIRGSPAKTGPTAGVTRHVNNMIKICARPPIYSIDTPGVLQPGITKSKDQAMRLALCASVNDAVLDPETIANYLLQYLNENENYCYTHSFGLKYPAFNLQELINSDQARVENEQNLNGSENPGKIPDRTKICWRFIREFRRGLYGKVIFE